MLFIFCQHENDFQTFSTLAGTRMHVQCQLSSRQVSLKIIWFQSWGPMSHQVHPRFSSRKWLLFLRRPCRPQPLPRSQPHFRFPDFSFPGGGKRRASDERSKLNSPLPLNSRTSNWRRYRLQQLLKKVDIIVCKHWSTLYVFKEWRLIYWISRLNSETSWEWLKVAIRKLTSVNAL